jgi:hypothetical protein
MALPDHKRGGILLKPKTVIDRHDEQWAREILKEAKEESKRSPKSRQEEDAEERRLLALGAAQAKKLGIKAREGRPMLTLGLQRGISLSSLLCSCSSSHRSSF